MSFPVRVAAYLWQHFWVIALGVHAVSLITSVILCQVYIGVQGRGASPEDQRYYLGWIALIYVMVAAIAFAGVPLAIGYALGCMLMAPVVFLFIKVAQRQALRQKPHGQ